MHRSMANKKLLQACRDEVDRVLPNSINPTYERMSDFIVCETPVDAIILLNYYILRR